jgi:hypothetical protein
MSNESVGYQGKLFGQGLQLTPWGKAVFQSLRYALRMNSAKSESLSEVAVKECSHVDYLAESGGYRHCMLLVQDATGSTGNMAWLERDGGPKRDLPFQETEVYILRKQFEPFVGKWKFESDKRPATTNADGFEVDISGEALVYMACGTAIIGMIATSLELDNLKSIFEQVSFHVGARGENIKDGDQLVLRGILLKEFFPQEGKPHMCTWCNVHIQVHFVRSHDGTPVGAQLHVECGPDEPMKKELSVSEAKDKGKLRTPNSYKSLPNEFDVVGPRNDQKELSM